MSPPYIFLAMNLLTQVVCVSGVNKLTSVRGKHVADRPTCFLIHYILLGDLFRFHERGSHSKEGHQPVSEYMVFRERLELFPRLWGWDGLYRVTGVLNRWSFCGKQEGIDSFPGKGGFVVFGVVGVDNQGSRDGFVLFGGWTRINSGFNKKGRSCCRRHVLPEGIGIHTT